MYRTERPGHLEALAADPVVVVVDVLNLFVRNLFYGTTIFLPVVTILIVLPLKDALVGLAALIVLVVAKASFSVQHEG
jgi:hypothetical protein